MSEEIDRVIKFCISILADFGLKDLHLYLSTRPEKRVGAEEDWDAAEKALKEALERTKLPFDVKVGDGAFYGPKIDIQLNDALGRQWQLSTIQFDFNLPERFKLAYAGDDGKEHRPFMIHRALLGSVERFFSILVEQFGGAFPTWLAPVQCIVLPINEAVAEYGEKIRSTLAAHNVRVEVADGSESLNKRIRNSLKSKIPNILVIGEKEMQAGAVTWRRYDNEKQTTVPFEEFTKSLLGMIENRM
jgi:threonyl-tRNA synthetase